MKKRLVIYGTIAVAVFGLVYMISPESHGQAGSVLLTLLGVLAVASVGLVIYFAPSIQAHQNRKKQSQAIFCLNLLLGWTILGWVAAMVWAVSKD
jgi:hypothetical protein